MNKKRSHQVEHRHFTQTCLGNRRLSTHSLKAAGTSAFQKHSGNKRSPGAVGNTWEHLPVFHPLLSLSPLLAPPSCSCLCYLSPSHCLSIPYLSLLCFLHLSLNISSTPPPFSPYLLYIIFAEITSKSNISLKFITGNCALHLSLPPYLPHLYLPN